MIILQFPVNNLVHSSHLRKCRDVSWASGFCVVWGFFEPVLAVISTRWTPWDVKLFCTALNFIWMKQDFSCNLQGFKSALQDPSSFLTMRPCWKDNTTALFLVSDRNCALQACSPFPLGRSCPRTVSEPSEVWSQIAAGTEPNPWPGECPNTSTDSPAAGRQCSVPGVSGSAIVTSCVSPRSRAEAGLAEEGAESAGRTEPPRATPGFRCSSDTAQGHCLTFKSCSKLPLQYFSFYSIFQRNFHVFYIIFITSGSVHRCLTGVFLCMGY